MNIIIILLSIICGIIIFFLILPFLTVLFSFFGKERITQTNIDKAYDFGCIITAYKNPDISKPLIQSLLNQPYENFHIYLVADECDISNWDVEHPQLTVFRPDPSLRLKAKSIIHAMEHYVRSHEYTIVFDADNLAHPDFLNTINLYCNNGHRAIQGQRTAKNLDTVYACMDSMGEFYKNYIERYAPYLIGSSSVISGSGMAVETELYWEYLRSPEIEQGKHQWKKMLQEDKILQNFLLRANEKIVYAWKAIVYDEKVVSGEQVETQRSRWLFSYFQNLPNSTGIIGRGLKNGSFNQFFFGLMTVSPPLFILLFSALLLCLISFFIVPTLSFALVGAVAIFSFTILWTLYLSKVPSQIWSALWGVPLFVFNQIKGLLKMGNPNKNFKHSEHTRTVSIDEVMKSGGSK